MAQETSQKEVKSLGNDRVELVPFEPHVHLKPFMELITRHADILAYVNFPDVKTDEEFMRDFYDKNIASGGTILFAILDKPPFLREGETGESNFAGVASVPRVEAGSFASEIGIMISPRFHRTHVASNAIGLLLLDALDPPSAGGKGLRRVEWLCHADNTASRRTAARMGFEFEGILRWKTALPRSRVGVPVDALEKRNGTNNEFLGRHTAIFSIVWEEWDQKRPAVIAQMQRRQ